MTRLMWSRAGWSAEGRRSHSTFPSRTWTPEAGRGAASSWGRGAPPPRGSTLSQRIWGGFSSRTDSFPRTSTALPGASRRPQRSRVRLKHSSSMEEVSSSTVA